jgi:hypothetical protein
MPCYSVEFGLDTAVVAHCGRADRAQKWTRVSGARLVERTAVVDGG